MLGFKPPLKPIDPPIQTNRPPPPAAERAIQLIRPSPGLGWKGVQLVMGPLQDALRARAVECPVLFFQHGFQPLLFEPPHNLNFWCWFLKGQRIGSTNAIWPSKTSKALSGCQSRTCLEHYELERKPYELGQHACEVRLCYLGRTNSKRSLQDDPKDPRCRQAKKTNLIPAQIHSVDRKQDGHESLQS